MKERFAIPAVGGIVRKMENGEEYILIQDRVKDNYDSNLGIIEIPAGKIREFENIFTCLKREIFEETGLIVDKIEGEDNVQVIEINGYKVITYAPYSSCQNIEGNYPIMVQIFLCTVKNNDLKIFESNESKNIRWIKTCELEILLLEKRNDFFPMHISVLTKYCKELKNTF